VGKIPVTSNDQNRSRDDDSPEHQANNATDWKRNQAGGDDLSPPVNMPHQGG
jgi:hypothetical protein